MRELRATVAQLQTQVNALAGANGGSVSPISGSGIIGSGNVGAPGGGGARQTIKKPTFMSRGRQPLVAQKTLTGDSMMLS